MPPRPGGGGAAAEGPGPKAERSAVTGTMSIGEVLGILKPEFPDITVSKIRFLEGAGLVQPDRSASGDRKFSDDDVARLRFVLRAQRDPRGRQQCSPPEQTQSQKDIAPVGHERPPPEVIRFA